jgi:hypothetical protein
METEKTPNLAAPYEGYLVFLRWAEGGLGIAGHLETPTLCRGRTQEETLARLGEFTLLEVKRLLDEAIERRAARHEAWEEEMERGAGGPGSEEEGG